MNDNRIVSVFAVVYVKLEECALLMKCRSASAELAHIGGPSSCKAMVSLVTCFLARLLQSNSEFIKHVKQLYRCILFVDYCY